MAPYDNSAEKEAMEGKIIRFLKLVRTPTDDGWTRYLDEPKLTQDDLDEIVRLFQELRHGASYVSHCTMQGCHEQHEVKIWTSMFECGWIRMDVLKYLVENKHMDPKDLSQQAQLLGVLHKMFSLTDCINLPGMDVRIRERIDFMLDWLSKEIPYELVTYVKFTSGQYIPIINATYYGGSRWSPGYLTRFLDLYEKHCPGRYLPYHYAISDLAHDYCSGEQLKAVECTNIDYSKTGQTILELVVSHGDHEILPRVMRLTDPADFSRYYMECQSNQLPGKYRRHAFMPLIPYILYWRRDNCHQKFMSDIAKCIEILLKTGKFDLNQTVKYVSGKEYRQSIREYNPALYTFEHTVTDFLHGYGYVYPGSPIYEVFKNTTLPPRLDETVEHIPATSYHEHGPYEDLYLQYQYIKKNPAHWDEIKRRVEEIYARSHNYEDIPQWYSIDGWDEMVKRFRRVHQERRNAIFQEHLRANQRTIGV